MKLFSSVVILASLMAYSVAAGINAFAQAGPPAAGSAEGWTKLCFDAPAGGVGAGESPRGAAKETVSACFTYAKIRDAPTQIDLGRLGVLQTKPSGRAFLIAFLPLGGASPPMNVLIDGAERIQLGDFLPDTCDYSGCPQRALMSPALLTRLRNAKAIAIGGVDITGRELWLPLPCCGFKAAFDDVPTPVSGKNDELRKLTETLAGRFADFTRKDWEKLCFDVPPAAQQRDGAGPSSKVTAGERSEACYTYIEVRYWPANVALAYIGVLETKEPARRVVAALFPHFGNMPRDPGTIEVARGWYADRAEIRLAYLPPSACDPGCYARADMPEPLLDRLRAATDITFRMDGLERGNLVPCCGFSDALNGAPVALEELDDTQRKIQENLRQHFADFMP